MPGSELAHASVTTLLTPKLMENADIFFDVCDPSAYHDGDGWGDGLGGNGDGVGYGPPMPDPHSTSHNRLNDCGDGCDRLTRTNGDGYGNGFLGETGYGHIGGRDGYGSYFGGGGNGCGLRG